MKKTFLSMLMIASCFSIANAQLRVDKNGRVGVGLEIETPNLNDTLRSRFSVNSIGNTSSTVYIESKKEALNALYVSGRAKENRNFYGVRSSINASQNNHDIYGVFSTITSASQSTGTVGAYGRSGNSVNKRNFGSVGLLYVPTSSENDCYGAAVYGSSITTSLPYIEGRYAGYFNGNARVTGVLTAGSVVTSSDYRLKENIRSLSPTDGCLSKLMDMNVVEFNNIQREYETSNLVEDTDESELMEMDSLTTIAKINTENENTKVCWYEEESPIIKNKHYGLIAQELKEIYPDLVVESQDGFLAINYLEIIPLLIRSVQELKCELDASKSSNAPVQREVTRTADAEATAIDAIVTTLYQNTPNPFTESTLIRCDVADDIVQADLYIYNMNGEQIAEYAVTERGETSITIDGGSLNAGMYLYALIADGQVIDTKRMILTK